MPVLFGGSYQRENEGKERMKKMERKTGISVKKIICRAAALAAVLCLTACGKKKESNVYGPTIAGLEDEELFALVEIGADSPVLLVTDQYYDDGVNQASIFCNVYYAGDGEVRKLGTIESLGTAYPVSYDDSGLYAGSGHGMQRFVIDDETDTLVLEEELAETFDSDGNASYTRTLRGETKMITEEEYLAEMEKYADTVTVHFVYGATGT